MKQLFDILLAPLRAIFSVITAPETLLQVPRRMLQLSLPAGVALAVAIFLVAVIVSMYFFVEQDQGWVVSDVWWRGFPVMLALAVFIPLVAYYLVQLWLEGDLSPFADIDRCWKQGLAKLAEKDIDPRGTPIYLVFGSDETRTERNLFDASHQSFQIHNFPEDNQPLHWYANTNGIYIVCSGVGCLTRLARNVRLSAAKRAMANADSTPSQPAAQPQAYDPMMTMMPGAMPSRPGEPSVQATATIAAQALAGNRKLPEPSQGIGGTMMFGEQAPPPSNGGNDHSEAAQPADLGPLESTRTEERRLAHLCRLLTKLRRPMAPVNGVMLLIPIDMLQADNRTGKEGHEITTAINLDTKVMLEELRVRCAATVLVTGLEREKGFIELMQRVGEYPRRNQRIGKGYPLWDPPRADSLELVAKHVCASLEGHVYEKFKEKEFFGKTSNHLLYALLCRIRSTMQGPLEKVLANGLGLGKEESQRKSHDRLLFNGCYVVGTGSHDLRQGFVASVFDLQAKRQADLEWTPTAQREEQLLQRVAYGVVFIDIAMFITWAGLIARMLWNR